MIGQIENQRGDKDLERGTDGTCDRIPGVCRRPFHHLERTDARRPGAPPRRSGFRGAVFPDRRRLSGLDDPCVFQGADDRVLAARDRRAPPRPRPDGAGVGFSVCRVYHLQPDRGRPRTPRGRGEKAARNHQGHAPSGDVGYRPLGDFPYDRERRCRRVDFLRRAHVSRPRGNAGDRSQEGAHHGRAMAGLQGRLVERSVPGAAFRARPSQPEGNRLLAPVGRLGAVRPAGLGPSLGDREASLRIKTREPVFSIHLIVQNQTHNHLRLFFARELQNDEAEIR